MKLQIRDFRSIEKADLELSDKITLVAGPNAVGKSSVAQALGLLLSGVGVDKDRARDLIRSGANTCQLSLMEGDRGATLALPSQSSRATVGAKPPYASIYATGLACIPAITDKKQRASAFIKYMGAEPTEADLLHAVFGEPSTGEPWSDSVNEERARTIGGVWATIEKQGWDITHDLRKKDGARFKGQWEQATGAPKYGAKVAESWTPQGWDIDLAEASKESLEAAIVEAREMHEAAIAVKAVDSTKRAELEAAAAKFDEGTALVGKLQQDLAALDEQIKQQDAKATELFASTGGTVPLTNPCPWEGCGKPIEIRNGKPTKPDEKRPTKEQRDAALAIAQAQQKAVDGLRCDRATVAGQHLVASTEVRKAMQAREELKQLAPPDEAPADVEASREAVRLAEQRLKAWQSKVDADRIHQSVVENQKIIDALAPQGLRQTKLAQALEAANEELTRLSVSDAGWAPITVDPDLTVRYNGFAYSEIAASEQFRVNAVFAVWCAAKDGSEIVVIDAADILDGPNRNGFFSLISMHRIVACMTCNFDAETAKREVPDLSAHNMGVTYWVQNGTVERHTQPRNPVPA